MVPTAHSSRLEVVVDHWPGPGLKFVLRQIRPLGHPGEIRLSEVIIHDEENFERALKRFKKKIEKAGILSDLRKHRHYEKPSERRKRKMNAARRKGRRPRPA
jgi:small subunit ribosomal protein S21